MRAASRGMAFHTSLLFTRDEQGRRYKHIVDVAGISNKGGAKANANFAIGKNERGKAKLFVVVVRCSLCVVRGHARLRLLPSSLIIHAIILITVSGGVPSLVTRLTQILWMRC